MTKKDPRPPNKRQGDILAALRSLEGSVTLSAISSETSLGTKGVLQSLRALARHDLVRFVSGEGEESVWEIVPPPL